MIFKASSETLHSKDAFFDRRKYMSRKKQRNVNKLAMKMGIGLVLGLLAGAGCIFLREYSIANGNQHLWIFLQNLLFDDITKQDTNSAIGIFYIIGQLFVNALQLVIIPMVFTSIALAMCDISDTKKLGRISYRTLSYFLLTSIGALLLAGIVGIFIYHAGWFQVDVNTGISQSTVSTTSNPLSVFLSIIPGNITTAFSSNSSVLAVVFLAVVTGLSMNVLQEKVKYLKMLLREIHDIVVVFLTFVIHKFGPFAIFVLVTRTFAIYGIEHLRPALIYVVVTIVCLLLYLVFGYGGILCLTTKLHPLPFIKKMGKVAMFGFSTSSSAATLPLNTKTTVEELGVHEDIASFTLPLGMTINMNGTAIMQTIAAIFIATSAGYEVTIGSVLLIAVLALIASAGTPAAPGAGAIILFTVLTGLGYTNDAAILAYSLILAINRPIEMVVTSLNVVGDSAACVYVAKSEGVLDEKQYYS